MITDIVDHCHCPSKNCVAVDSMRRTKFVADSFQLFAVASCERPAPQRPKYGESGTHAVRGLPREGKVEARSPPSHARTPFNHVTDPGDLISDKRTT